MPLTLILLSGLLVSATALAAFGLRVRSRNRARRARMLAAIVACRHLLEAMAQHRGLANALLSGDDSFRDKLRAAQTRAERHSRELDALLPNTPAWSRLSQDWRQLTDHVGSLNVTDSFAQHCGLIERLIRLMGTLCDEQDLWSGLSSHHRTLLKIAVAHLPPLIDTLGQARGLGSGAIVKHRVDAPLYVKLKFLAKQSRLSLESTAQLLGNLPPTLRHELSSSEARTRHACTQFLSTLEEELLNKRKPTLASHLYFDAGTAAIGDALGLLNRMLDEIEPALRASVRRER